MIKFPFLFIGENWPQFWIDIEAIIWSSLTWQACWYWFTILCSLSIFIICSSVLFPFGLIFFITESLINFLVVCWGDMHTRQNLITGPAFGFIRAYWFWILWFASTTVSFGILSNYCYKTRIIGFFSVFKYTPSDEESSNSYRCSNTLCSFGSCIGKSLLPLSIC